MLTLQRRLRLSIRAAGDWPWARAPSRIGRRSIALWSGLVAVALGLAFILVLPLWRPLDPLPKSALVLVTSDGRPIARRGLIKDVPVKLASLPEHVPEAFVAIEDRRFWRHWGLDLRGIGRAAAANVRAGEVVQGGSTITQQLAKTAFLDSDRTYVRKVQEAVIAVWLEARLTKREILERYLSSVYFGDRVYGLTAAARHYFDKAPERLTLSEAAMLAGLVKAPSRLAPTQNPREADRRRRLVLNAMKEQGLISEDESRQAGRVHVTAAQSELPVGTYFADWVSAAARERIGPQFGETVVRTTLNSRAQQAAERAVQRGLKGRGQTQAALVALSPDGAIRAMVGGRSYGQSQFNRATQAKRQPGSAFKLAVYLAALRHGATPDSTVENTPLRVGLWRPRNAGDAYTDSLTLREAFANSSNVAAVRLQQRVGVGAVMDAARDLGIVSELRRDPTLALGTSETSLLELAAAYATVAGGRGPVRPYGVEGAGGIGGERLNEEHRAMLLDMLAETVEVGTAGRARMQERVFGKTGTSQDGCDGVFVGFVDGLVVAVWVGRDDRTPVRNLSGGGLPAEIWRDFMMELGVRRGLPWEAGALTAPRPNGAASNWARGQRRDDRRELRLTLARSG